MPLNVAMQNNATIKDRRSDNLNLIRKILIGRHKDTAKELAKVANSNYISQMATGDMEISDHQAREIEITLQLPCGWMDRDNIQLLKIEATEFNILSHITTQPQFAKDGLLSFLSASTK